MASMSEDATTTSESNRIFVRIKRKREDLPLDYLVWNEERSVGEEGIILSAKKKKTFRGMWKFHQSLF